MLQFLTKGLLFARINHNLFTRGPRCLSTDSLGLRPASCLTETTDHSTTEIFIAISDLVKQGVKLNFPTLVSTGPQSSGKSSVLEAICGFNILPKKMGMATLKPINLATIRDDTIKFRVGDREFTSEESTRREIERLNSNGEVSAIDVRIHSPHVHNIFMTDLPGLFFVTDGVDSTLPKRVKAMNVEYIRNPHNIPVVVTSAAQDPATNMALQLVNTNNRDKDAIGIITKADLTKKQDTELIQSMLKGDKFKLGNGWVTVILRNSNDDAAGITIDQKMKEEEEFFKTKSTLRPSGVKTMRQMIADLQFRRIKDQIPSLIEEVDRRIDDLRTSESFLSNLINDPNKSIAIKLELLIRKLVGSSLERARFERNLKEQFRLTINDYMEKTFKDENTTFVLEKSNQFVDSHIYKYLNSVGVYPDDIQHDTFEELFSYGLVSPILVNPETIIKAYNNECKLGGALSTIDIVIDDPLGEKRMRWYNYLSRYFAILLSNDSIQNVVYQITEKMILEYVKNDPEGCDDLTTKFSQYIVHEIGTEAYNSHIKFAIESLIRTEKRPHISANDIVRNLVKMFPKNFKYDNNGLVTMIGLGSGNKSKLEAYGEIWNQAYLGAVSDKLSENIYRTIAVILLDNMVKKLLEMTIDMFNRENAMQEQNKVGEKIRKLHSIKSVLIKHNELENTKTNRVICEDTQNITETILCEFQEEHTSPTNNRRRNSRRT